MKFNQTKRLAILIPILFFMSVNCFAQNKIEPYPTLKGLVAEEFQNNNNLFPIANVNVTIGNRPFRIPIIYSCLFHTIDSKQFFFKGDYVDNYSFQILENGISKPMFKKEALFISKDQERFLNETRKRYETAMQNLNLNQLIEFPKVPDWWQFDQTPKDEAGKTLVFICEINLLQIFDDDCKMYVFFDPKKKLVRQIYQR
jgi:hypothetical protein